MFLLSQPHRLIFTECVMHVICTHKRLKTENTIIRKGMAFIEKMASTTIMMFKRENREPWG